MGSCERAGRGNCTSISFDPTLTSSPGLKRAPVVDALAILKGVGGDWRTHGTGGRRGLTLCQCRGR